MNQLPEVVPANATAFAFCWARALKHEHGAATRMGCLGRLCCCCSCCKKKKKVVAETVVAEEPPKLQAPPEDEIRGRSQWADGAR